MTSFRDAVADVTGTGDGMARFDPNYAMADKVLAMNEMRALRTALVHAAHNAARYAYPMGTDATRIKTYLAQNCGLQPHVIDWLFGNDVS